MEEGAGKDRGGEKIKDGGMGMQAVTAIRERKHSEISSGDSTEQLSARCEGLKLT